MSAVGELPAPRQEEIPPKNSRSSGLPRTSESLGGPPPRRICPSTALQWTAFRAGHFSWPWRNVDAKVRQSPARIPVRDARRGKERPAAEVIPDKSARRVWSAWSQRNDNATTRNNYSHHRRWSAVVSRKKTSHELPSRPSPECQGVRGEEPYFVSRGIIDETQGGSLYGISCTLSPTVSRVALPRPWHRLPVTTVPLQSPDVLQAKIHRTSGRSTRA